MTRNDIDDLMRDSNIVVVGEAVYALCQIVAAHEREACAKVCLEEAKEAYHQEAFYLPRGNQWLLRIAEGATRCAAAIRARGEAEYKRGEQ